MEKDFITPQQAASSEAAGLLSRSGFLNLAWKTLLALSGGVGLSGVMRYLSYQTTPAAPTAYDLGPTENYPPGIRASIPEAQAVIVHGEAGLQAFSLVCPHLGCQVDPVDAGYACPCHGSRFGLQGELENGPAAEPLRRLALETNESGHLILHQQPAS